jgi:hypothetical protein
MGEEEKIIIKKKKRSSSSVFRFPSNLEHLPRRLMDSRNNTAEPCSAALLHI